MQNCSIQHRVTRREEGPRLGFGFGNAKKKIVIDTTSSSIRIHTSSKMQPLRVETSRIDWSGTMIDCTSLVSHTLVQTLINHIQVLLTHAFAIHAFWLVE